MAVGPITDIIEDVNLIISGVVQKSWTVLSQDNAVAIATLFLLLIMWIGFEAMTGSKTVTASSAAKKILIAGIAYVFMTDWNAFNYVFVRFPVEWPDEIINTLSKAITNNSLNVYGALDALALEIMGISDYLYQKAGFSAAGLGYLAWAIGYTVLGSIIICVIVGLMSAFKILLAIVTMIAIIPLGCLMFPSTRRIFFNFVETMIGFAFMPVLIVAAAVFTLGIIGTYTQDLSTGVVDVSVRNLTLTMWVLGISLVVFFLLVKSLPRIGSGLFR